MAADNPELSFEFFPPHTDKGVVALSHVHKELQCLQPEFISVTFGAGGSTREGTFDAVKSLVAAGSNVAPHITSIGCSRAYIRTIVESYLDLGVSRFVLLRGDLPGGMVERGEFKYATELVAFIRDEFGEDLHLEVAAYPDTHPESRTPQADLENFKRKIDAGANSAITQYFYNADSYFSLIDDAQRIGIDVPIIPGIMPITNFAALTRFSEGCGADIPKWIYKRLRQYRDDEASLREFGLDVVTHLCLDLLDNQVPGLHFYTLNKTQPVMEICRRVGFQAQQ